MHHSRALLPTFDQNVFQRRERFQKIQGSRVSRAGGCEGFCHALAAVPSCVVGSIYFFVSAGFSRAESPAGGEACPWQPPVEFQSNTTVPLRSQAVLDAWFAVNEPGRL